jgi:hypothetical protein
VHLFNIEYGYIVENGTLWHCFEQVAAKNEDQVINDFLHRTKIKLVSRPIINGHKTRRDVNEFRGHLSWASYSLVRDSIDVEDRAGYFGDCDKALIDLGDYTFCGGHILHTQLNSESGRNE